jgi:hypothetical protein
MAKKIAGDKSPAISNRKTFITRWLLARCECKQMAKHVTVPEIWRA